MTCDLCKEYSPAVRSAMFKKNRVSICPDCLKQFKIIGLDQIRIMLEG